MVTFKLVEETDNGYIYWYYPEGDEEKRPGIIVVDKNMNDIELTELAEKDWERYIPVEEINEMVDSINQMKRERGATDFLEYATEPEHNIWYGDHAVNEICKFLRKGEIPEKGIQMWY